MASLSEADSLQFVNKTPRPAKWKRDKFDVAKRVRETEKKILDQLISTPIN